MKLLYLLAKAHKKIKLKKNQRLDRCRFIVLNIIEHATLLPMYKQVTIQLTLLCVQSASYKVSYEK